jgi:hypothetical protein
VKKKNEDYEQALAVVPKRNSPESLHCTKRPLSGPHCLSVPLHWLLRRAAGRPIVGHKVSIALGLGLADSMRENRGNVGVELPAADVVVAYPVFAAVLVFAGAFADTFDGWCRIQVN